MRSLKRKRNKKPNGKNWERISHCMTKAVAQPLGVKDKKVNR